MAVAVAVAVYEIVGVQQLFLHLRFSVASFRDPTLIGELICPLAKFKMTAHARAVVFVQVVGTEFLQTHRLTQSNRLSPSSSSRQNSDDAVVS